MCVKKISDLLVSRADEAYLHGILAFNLQSACSYLLLMNTDFKGVPIQINEFKSYSLNL
jgi:hypothetical protein